jgi:hypothetical protein
MTAMFAGCCVMVGATAAWGGAGGGASLLELLPQPESERANDTAPNRAGIHDFRDDMVFSFIQRKPRRG